MAPAQLLALRRFASAYGRLLTLAASAIEHGHLPEQAVHRAIKGERLPRGVTLKVLAAQLRVLNARAEDAVRIGIHNQILAGRATAIHSSIEAEWDLALPAPDLR